MKYENLIYEVAHMHQYLVGFTYDDWVLGYLFSISKLS